MIVCLCRGVTERTVKQAVCEGACTVEDIGDHCRAGTGCGACHGDIERIVDETHAELAIAASARSPQRELFPPASLVASSRSSR